MPRTEKVRSADQPVPRSTAEANRRKSRVLTKQRASITHSISEAIVVKDGDLFFLSEADGKVPLKGAHGCGLYFHDCRYLNGYEMRLAEADLDVLSASAEAGDRAVHELTNPDLDLGNGRLLQKEELGVKLQRVVDGSRTVLHDEVSVQNFAPQTVELPLALTFRAVFEDLFEVRGLLAERLGHPRPPRWNDGTLHLAYDGADDIYRELTIRCSPKPVKTDGTTAEFRVRLESQATWQLQVSFAVAESKEPSSKRAKEQPKAQSGERSKNRPGGQSKTQARATGGPGNVRHDGAAPATAVPSPSQEQDWLSRCTSVESSSLVLAGVIDRSLRDLRTLRSTLREREYFAAGVPWYVTLFGRDSLISSLETLAYDPGMAEQTLRLLASYQSTEVDQWRDAQPGKMPHELRFGEMAHLGEIPHSPYYGTIDATPLFLIVLGRHAEWTGDLTLFHELRENVDHALEWIDRYGDRDEDGYLEYRSTAKKGLVNQGWKDSGNAIVNADGSLAEPPIALVEVQAYVYAAKSLMAGLFRRAGEADRAAKLEQQATNLRERFNHDYWLDDPGFFALALQKDGKPARVVSSNPGHALWCGIIDDDKAARTAERLMRDDMFSGWGVRTLSATERAFNPIGYHVGTVWPHDNALLAVGMRRYGFDDAFRRILNGMVDAAAHFHNYRLPEVFSGFNRSEYRVPVKYPVACHPQAWAAGAVPYMVTAALGLVPEAFDRRLRIVQPILPPFVAYVELFGLRVGDARADLRFEQGGRGKARAKVLRVDGELEVSVGEAA